jgi:hypothetical protein
MVINLNWRLSMLLALKLTPGCYNMRIRIRAT